MSQLSGVCLHLAATAGAMRSVAAELGGRARELRRTAAALSAGGTAVGGTAVGGAPLGGVPARSAAERLFDAAQACEQAAALLQSAAAQGDAYVRRTVSGSGSATGSYGGADASRGEPGEDPAESGNGLTAAQRVYVADHLRTAAGSAYYPNTDREMRDSAELVGAFPGEYVLDLHGDADAVGCGDPPVELTAREFAAVVRCTGWAGQPIRLISCSTGAEAGGFAQQLADELGVVVTAPTTLVFAGPGGVQVNEGAYVLNPVTGTFVHRPLGKPGEWVRFTPRTATGEESR